MAINKKAAQKSAKPSKSAPQQKSVAKPVAKVNKAIPAKKPAAKATPAKKTVVSKATKIVASKATKSPVKVASAKKASVIGKAISKPATAPKKAIAPAKPVKSVKPAPKPAAKAATKPAPKKAAPQPVKKAVVKPVPPAKKAIAKPLVAKPVPKAAAKPAAKPVPQPEIKAPKKPKKAAKPVKITIPQAPKPQPKPAPTPATFLNRDEKKANVVVAHRKAENKAKDSDTTGITMVNYQPDYTRSILDGPNHEPTGPVYRYSDEELNEFRTLITNRLESARKELSYLQGLITRKDEAGTEDTENRYMNMEDGSGAMEREQLAQLASRQIMFISHLEKAMIRIENKTYGICRVTGNLIDKARLRAVPHATLSIDAKKMMAAK